jgi:stage II sporulation protein AA (anti-sigma F factor antagonist)
MMTLDLTIESSRSGDILVIKFSGDLDDYNAPKALSFLATEIEKGIRRIVVDLDAIKFMDSIGLGVIVKTTKNLQAMGGKLIIVCNKPQILRLIETSGLLKAKRLHVMEDLGKAIDII